MSSMEISRNILISGDETIQQMVAHANSPDILIGDKFATVIRIEHQEDFDRGVLRVIRGLHWEAIHPTPLPDGNEIIATVFGFNYFAGMREGQPHSFFVPNVYRAFLPMLGPDPQNALHGYHADLIYRTNETLKSLSSPFRLAPLALASQTEIRD